MNNQARSCELKCKYNIQGICHAYGECIAKDLFISELEKIRAEIENHCGLAKEEQCKYCSYCNNLMGVREILEIIDKYKAELKGENNA